MRSIVSLRRAPAAAARFALGATLAVAVVSFGCRIDENGLAATSDKLQRDGGGTGGVVIIGSGGNLGSGGNFGTGGGVLGSGGGLGDGGTSASGGTNGSGGVISDGTGGASASGGTPGTGGVAGAMGAGGVTDTGGMDGTGGIAGTGGTPATGGASGTGGAISTGGTPGTGGAGTGGRGTGGNPGTGGSGIKCGPGTCTGCCGADGQCVRTVTARQCGTAGAACVACAPCQICSNSGLTGAKCAIDPTSQWTIAAVSGQVSTNPPSGATWDPVHGDEGGTTPDLFCEYENPSGSVSPTTAGVTDTITDVFTANWNQTITPSGVTISASALMASKPAWRIWVGDEDCSTPTKCGTAGQTACSYQQPISAASLMSGGTTIRNIQNCVALTLSFACQAPAAATP
jgi:hypothetical protein